jgi:hypothetical protein
MKIVFVLLGIGVFIGVLTYLTIGEKQLRVEVCVEFQGRKNCRIASGTSREAALRAATDNACATITSGMTESMACSHNPPASVKWLP